MAEDRKNDLRFGVLLFRTESASDGEVYAGSVDKNSIRDQIASIDGEKVQFYVNLYDGEWKDGELDPPNFRLTIRPEYNGSENRSAAGSGPGPSRNNDGVRGPGGAHHDSTDRPGGRYGIMRHRPNIAFRRRD